MVWFPAYDWLASTIEQSYAHDEPGIVFYQYLLSPPIGYKPRPCRVHFPISRCPRIPPPGCHPLRSWSLCRPPSPHPKRQASQRGTVGTQRSLEEASRSARFLPHEIGRASCRERVEISVV